MNLREPISAGGYPKLQLSIMTYSVEMARRLWPAAGEGDVGDLKLHFDPADPNEVLAAKAVYEAARHLGTRFFLLRPGDVEGGRLIEQDATWEDVLALASTPEDEAPAESVSEPTESAEGKPRRGRRQPPVIAGVPPMRGG